MNDPINPHRITVALDMAKLTGPTADAKVGAREPDLDEWEAGRLRPTPLQLETLGELANLTTEFFSLGDDEYPRIITARVMLGGRRRCVTHICLNDAVPASLRRQGVLL